MNIMPNGGNPTPYSSIFVNQEKNMGMHEIVVGTESSAT
jgi:hypothetical protein